MATPPSDPGYNPNSIDAVLSRMEARQLTNSEEILQIKALIKDGFASNDTRISSLEHERWVQRGVVATISAGISAAFAWFTSRS